MASLSGLSVFERGTFPRWVKARQQLDATEITDVSAAIANAFARPEVKSAITPGTRVCLTAGSRGIHRIADVLKAAVVEVRKLGGEPFIIPAMGSHGGATADGQLGMIARLRRHPRGDGV